MNNRYGVCQYEWLLFLQLMIIRKANNLIPSKVCAAASFLQVIEKTLDAAKICKDYVNEFIWSILKHHQREGKIVKVLLIINNAPTHLSLNQLIILIRSEGTILNSKCHTAITTPWIKILYKTWNVVYQVYWKLVLYHLLLAEWDEGNVVFIKRLNLKDWSYKLADVWENRTQDSLQNWWNKLWFINEQVFNELKTVNFLAEKHPEFSTTQLQLLRESEVQPKTHFKPC